MKSGGKIDSSVIVKGGHLITSWNTIKQCYLDVKSFRIKDMNDFHFDFGVRGREELLLDVIYPNL